MECARTHEYLRVSLPYIYIFIYLNNYVKMQGKTSDSCTRVVVNHPLLQVRKMAMGAERGRLEKMFLNSNDKVPKG